MAALGAATDSPAVVQFADEVVVRHPCLVDEHFVEQRATGHLAQRADLDTGLAHREDEVRKASMLREVGIGSGDEDPEVGPLTK